MKIILLPSLYFPNIGGIEDFSKDLARNLILNGHQVLIITKKWPEDLKERDLIDGIEVLRVNSAKTKSQYADLDKWIQENKLLLEADVIHVIGVRRCLPILAIKIQKTLGIPVIMTIAGGEIPQEGDILSKKIWERDQKIIRKSLRLSAMVTSFSEGLKKNVLKVLPKVEVSVLYAGINMVIFKNIKKYIQKNKKDYIVCARRLCSDKGVDVLIDAFSLIEKKHSIDLFIIGDGPELINLKLQAKRMRLDKRIIFLKGMPLLELLKFLKGAIFTVVPSRSEGGGLINIEAQAVGCPVIASDVGGIPEYVVNGISGILVPPDNPKTLALEMNNLLSDEQKRRKLVRNGKKNCLKFSWDLLIHQYIFIYKKVINDNI